MIFDYQPRRKSAVCKDGFAMSVQASEHHYCSPRSNGVAMSYTSVEIGFPSEKEDLLIDYAEDMDNPTGTVYPYVPAQVVLDVIEKHGGLVEGDIPGLDLTNYDEFEKGSNFIIYNTDEEE